MLTRRIQKIFFCVGCFVFVGNLWIVETKSTRLDLAKGIEDQTFFWWRTQKVWNFPVESLFWLWIFLFCVNVWIEETLARCIRAEWTGLRETKFQNYWQWLTWHILKVLDFTLFIFKYFLSFSHFVFWSLCFVVIFFLDEMLICANNDQTHACKTKKTLHNTPIGWLQLVGSIKLQVFSVEYSPFYRTLLQKRPIMLSILLTEATPMILADETYPQGVKWWFVQTMSRRMRARRKKPIIALLWYWLIRHTLIVWNVFVVSFCNDLVVSFCRDWENVVCWNVETIYSTDACVQDERGLLSDLFDNGWWDVSRRCECFSWCFFFCENINRGKMDYTQTLRASPTTWHLYLYIVMSLTCHVE